MAKIDWDISGVGGISVVSHSGSMRCQLSGSKLMLWNGNSTLVDSEIEADIRFDSYHTSYINGGMVLRMDAGGNNGYRLRVYGYNSTTRRYKIESLTSGTITTLADINSAHPYYEFVPTRFRIDGWQLSVEEFDAGAWNLITMVEDTELKHASGYAGLFGSSANTSYWILFDNINIRNK